VRSQRESLVGIKDCCNSILLSMKSIKFWSFLLVPHSSDLLCTHLFYCLKLLAIQDKASLFGKPSIWDGSSIFGSSAESGCFVLFFSRWMTWLLCSSTSDWMVSGLEIGGQSNGN
jgi:hypothetical protein